MSPISREALDQDSLGRTVITSLAQSVYCNGQLVAVEGSALSTILTPGIITQGSDKVIVEGKRLAGVGYATTGGVMVTGSSNSFMPPPV